MPAAPRKKYGIKKGSRLSICEHNEKIIVEPVHKDPVTEGRGMLKTRGRVLKCLLAERKKEAKI